MLARTRLPRERFNPLDDLLLALLAHAGQTRQLFAISGDPEFVNRRDIQLLPKQLSLFGPTGR